MTTYLLAFIISDLKNISNAPGHFPHRFFTQEKLLDAADYGLLHGESALSTLQNYVNVNYSLPKMDQVVVPNLAFPAMENWGMNY